MSYLEQYLRHVELHGRISPAETVRLAALRELVELNRQGRGDRWERMNWGGPISKARNAIARATGEEA